MVLVTYFQQTGRVRNILAVDLEGRLLHKYYMISFIFGLIITVVLSHPTHGEQNDSCTIVFNNIHNGYTYKLTGKCMLTKHSFQIVAQVSSGR